MTNGKESRPPSLAEVMQQHPLLTYFGVGVFDHDRKTPEQRQGEVVTGREELAAHEEGVFEVADWLSGNVTPIKTPGTGSYNLKHVVEQQLGRYVSNGEAIAAALMVGYPHRYDQPNVLFAMSREDLKRLQP